MTILFYTSLELHFSFKTQVSSPKYTVIDSKVLFSSKNVALHDEPSANIYVWPYTCGRRWEPSVKVNWNWANSCLGGFSRAMETFMTSQTFFFNIGFLWFICAKERQAESSAQTRKHTSGGRILQMPDFSAMGRILLMNPKGSEKSSQLGSNTGHSGGGTNSANADIVTGCQNESRLNTNVTGDTRACFQQSEITCEGLPLVVLPPLPLLPLQHTI